MLLLEAIELYNDNWSEVAEHVGTKSQLQCIMYFLQMPIEDQFMDQMTSGPPQVTHKVVDDGHVHTKPEDPIPFADTNNPVMAQVIHGIELFLFIATQLTIVVLSVHVGLIELVCGCY